MNSTTRSLLAFTIFVSCHNSKEASSDNFITNIGRLDTVKPIISTSFKGRAYPSIFEAAFQKGTKVSNGEITYNFDKLDIGKITIESGKVIACDPVVMHDASPFTCVFPRGEFPVNVAMAKINNDERVAFARIVFSNNAISKWEFALQRGQKQISLTDTNFYCYGVDAGTGIFIDSISNELFSKKGHSEWENVFITKAESNGYKGYTHDFDGHNLATFSTGYGDGCYATYIGFDSQGNVSQLLTDFGLVQWTKLAEDK